MVEGLAVHLMCIPPGIYTSFRSLRPDWSAINSTNFYIHSKIEQASHVAHLVSRIWSTLVTSHHTCSNSTRHLNSFDTVPVISTFKKTWFPNDSSNILDSKGVSLYTLEIWRTHQFLSSPPARAREISKASTLTRLGHSRFKPEKSTGDSLTNNDKLRVVAFPTFCTVLFGVSLEKLISICATPEGTLVQWNNTPSSIWWVWWLSLIFFMCALGWQHISSFFGWAFL